MSDCGLMGSCPFFNDKLAKMPSTAERLKKQYCHQDWSECARWMVRSALGPARVPSDLFPHDRKRAVTLIGTR